MFITVRRIEMEINEISSTFPRGQIAKSQSNGGFEAKEWTLVIILNDNFSPLVFSLRHINLCPQILLMFALAKLLNWFASTV